MSGRNTVRYKYCRICFGINACSVCDDLVASCESKRTSHEAMSQLIQTSSWVFHTTHFTVAFCIIHIINVNICGRPLWSSSLERYPSRATLSRLVTLCVTVEVHDLHMIESVFLNADLHLHHHNSDHLLQHYNFFQ